MPGELDFSMTRALLATLVICFLQPLCLLAATRLPRLKGDNSLQFLLSAAITVALWAVTVLTLPFFHPAGLVDAVVCLMALAGAMLLSLEAWGLLSRGYTLGVLLTLLNAKSSLTEKEISAQYRGGDGLGWIMQHRLGGLIAFGLVERDGDRLALTPVRGLAVARICEAGVVALGLRRTG